MAGKSEENADWSLATREGATGESLRRWAELPLERTIAALEEMQVLNEVLHGVTVSTMTIQTTVNIQEPQGDYGREGNNETPR